MSFIYLKTEEMGEIITWGEPLPKRNPNVFVSPQYASREGATEGEFSGAFWKSVFLINVKFLKVPNEKMIFKKVECLVKLLKITFWKSWVFG